MTAPVPTPTNHLAGSQVATSLQPPTSTLAVPWTGHSCYAAGIRPSCMMRAFQSKWRQNAWVHLSQQADKEAANAVSRRLRVLLRKPQVENSVSRFVSRNEAACA